MQVDFNKNILNQLLVIQPNKAVNIDNKFPQLNDWQQSKKKPTLIQLSGLADYFNIPFGYFFLNKLPIKEYPITHYRTIKRGKFMPSQELLDTIKIIEERQKWATYTLNKMHHETVEFANTVSIEDDIEETAQKIRDILDLHENWAKYENFSIWNDAFKFLVNRVERAGIFVVINGVVGNDTTRLLDLNEFRGFVLYDKFAPFIFINNKDFVTGKIFTLIHEFVHVLIGKSASFDFSNLQPANNAIEEFCDSVTAEFLVSKKSLIQDFARIGKDYQKLAYNYRVSKIVIIRRLLDLDIISYDDFITALNDLKHYRNENNRQTDTDGGNYYNSQPNRISNSFFNLLYSAVKQDKLLYRDAFRLTGLTPKGFDIYSDKFITKIS